MPHSLRGAAFLAYMSLMSAFLLQYIRLCDIIGLSEDIVMYRLHNQIVQQLYCFNKLEKIWKTRVTFRRFIRYIYQSTAQVFCSKTRTGKRGII